MAYTVAQHEKNLRGMGCMVCLRTPVSLHHPLGGSMMERVGMRGAAMKCSDYLQLPLCHDHHQGQNGIHAMEAPKWELLHGEQARMVDRLCITVGVDLWELAKVEKEQRRTNRTYTRSSKILPRIGE